MKVLHEGETKHELGFEFWSWNYVWMAFSRV